MYSQRGNSSVGRARPCQGRGREFKSRFPLHKDDSKGHPFFVAGRVSGGEAGLGGQAESRFRHQEPSHNRSSTGIRLIFGSASARHLCPQVLQRHPGVTKGASGRSSARRTTPQVLQCHLCVARRKSTGPSPRPSCPRHLRGWFCAMNTDLETSVSGKGSSYGSEHRERISSPCNSGFNGKFCLRYRLHFIIFASECSEYIQGTRKRQEHLRANRRRTGNAIREGSGLCYRQN